MLVALPAVLRSLRSAPTVREPVFSAGKTRLMRGMITQTLTRPVKRLRHSSPILTYAPLEAVMALGPKISLREDSGAEDRDGASVGWNTTSYGGRRTGSCPRRAECVGQSTQGGHRVFWGVADATGAHAEARATISWLLLPLT